MQHIAARICVVSGWTGVLFSAAGLGAADWPTYRADGARSARTTEQLAFPLALAWKYVPAQKPQPAWPDPYSGRYGGMNFDYAPQPVIAGRIVCFGSTSDNTLWALDAKSGKTLWGFTTGGPIRFAPAIYQGRAYVVSDDGRLYCLDAATGKLLWEFRAGPNDRRMIGNGRMISRWPIRSGLAVDRGVVYFAAGMWPSEGVYVFAVDAKTGNELWCRDANLAYIKRPHCGAYALAGNMPQGYLALSDKMLVFNNGFAGCWAYDRHTGDILGHDRPPRKKVPNRRGNSALLAIAEDGTYFHDSVRDGNGKEPLPVLPQHAALAGDTLIQCLPPRVVARAGGGSGGVIWEHAIDGEAAGIAVGSGMLVVSSTDGVIYCFQPGQAGETEVVGPGTVEYPAQPVPPAVAAILRELAVRKISKGYALVLGDEDARLAASLAAQTELQVICALRDEDKVHGERVRLRERTALYGSHASVDYLQTPAELPYPPYFANLVVVGPHAQEVPEAEIMRVLRPCGGLLFRGGRLVLQRGKLPGAFDWDSEATCDQRVRWPLEMLWFGEPGPSLQGEKGYDPPVPANGRVFILGKHYLICVDAYNGTILWKRKWSSPRAKGKRVAADDHYVYVSDKEESFLLDAQTGRTLEQGSEALFAEHHRITGPQTNPLRLPRRSAEDEQQHLGMRIHPLTGVRVGKGYVKAHGCGPVVSSASMDFFRSATLGFYDFDDDSGLRNLAGVRPACTLSSIPALGLFIAREGQGAKIEGDEWTCSCGYTYQTSLALVPAEHRREEDWAVFSDPVPQATAGPLRRVAVNFGAPGDRRDRGERLWLAAPRLPAAAKHGYTSICLPLVPEFLQGPLPYVPVLADLCQEPQVYCRSADRVPITGTDKPWIYTSGLRGLKRLTFDLYYYDRKVQYFSLPCAAAPDIDGKLTDPCWDGAAEIFPARYFHSGTENKRGFYFAALYRERSARTPEFAYLRHDEQNLYLAYRRRALADAAGNVQPWKAATKGSDAPVWEDDAFEVYVSGGETTIHLGISCSGATYDALVQEPFWPKSPPREDSSWDGVWTAAAEMNRQGIEFEMAIPWKTLQQLGMDRDHLLLYLEKKTDLSPYAKRITLAEFKKQAQSLVLAAEPPGPRPYTVRLHFAELENDGPGRRVFDVKLQGQVVIEDLDIFAAAGGRNRALVRELSGIMCRGRLDLSLVPKVPAVNRSSEPILSALEIVAEQPGPLPPPVMGRMVGSRGKRHFMLQSQIEGLDPSQRRRLGLDGPAGGTEDPRVDTQSRSRTEP